MTDVFWIQDPHILLNKNYLGEIFPSKNMTKNQKLNAITRLILLLSIIGFLILKNYKILITGLFTIVMIVLIQYTNSNSNLNSINENFDNLNNTNKVDINKYDTPTSNNPLMNVLLTDIKDNVNKKPAAPAYNEKVEKKINTATKDFIMGEFKNNKDFDDKLFKDLGDSYEFETSMRQWYSTPNTKVVNDQKAFANFCYGNMESCKEGDSLACTKTMAPQRINGNG